MAPFARAKSWLLALYLGTAPVQWLPGVDDAWVSRGKVVLFAVAVGAVLFGTPWARLRLPGGLAGPLGFAALIAFAVPGLAQSSLMLSAGYVEDVVSGAVMLWCFYNVARLDDVAGKDILDRSAMILAAFAAVALVLGLAGLGWQSSCAIAPFRDTAFGCSRTGWSGGLALYLPVLVVFAFRRDIGVLRRWLYLALAAAVVAGQAGSGGRAGVAASFVVVAVFVYYFMPRRWKVLGAAATLLAAAAVTIPGALSEQLRLDEIPKNPTSLMDWDYVSSGRIAGALEAAGLIAERPLAGHGIEAVTVEFRGGRYEVHNLWLKWAAYCGVFAPLLFLALVIVLLVLARRLAYETSAQSLGRGCRGLGACLGARAVDAGAGHAVRRVSEQCAMVGRGRLDRWHGCRTTGTPRQPMATLARRRGRGWPCIGRVEAGGFDAHGLAFNGAGTFDLRGQFGPLRPAARLMSPFATLMTCTLECRQERIMNQPLTAMTSQRQSASTVTGPAFPDGSIPAPARCGAGCRSGTRRGGPAFAR